MSGYDWQPEHEDVWERAREWDRADDRERWERKVRDRLERDVGENRETRMPLADWRPIVPPTMHEGEA